VRVADLLSGLPLQQLPTTEAQKPATNGATVTNGRVPAHAPHHPHEQTGPTPQLHP